MFGSIVLQWEARPRADWGVYTAPSTVPPIAPGTALLPESRCLTKFQSGFETAYGSASRAKLC